MRRVSQIAFLPQRILVPRGSGSQFQGQGENVKRTRRAVTAVSRAHVQSGVMLAVMRCSVMLPRFPFLPVTERGMDACHVLLIVPDLRLSLTRLRCRGLMPATNAVQ